MQVSSAMEEQDGEMVVKRLSVPVGLEELMTGLTREVLEKKPKDLYTFASEHFGQLLALRDNGNYRNPPSRSFAFYDQDDMENRTPNGNLRKSRSGGGSGRQLSRQVSIRAESPARKSRIRRSGTPKHDDNNNSEGKTKAKQDKSKPARRQTPGNKSKFDNLQPVKEGALKVVAKKENLSKRSTDKKSKDSSGSKDSKRSSSEESERLKKKGENFRETKGKSKTERKEAGEGSAKFVPKSSSVEEATTGIKDGRLTVTPPKIIKEAQSPTDQLDLPTTLVVPVLTAASSCLSVDAGKKESGQDEDIRKALKNDSETGEILSVSKEDPQDSSSKNYDSSALKEELKKVEEEAKLNNFTTSYNPYKLRQEIKNASKEGDDHENIDALGTESAAGETQPPHVNLTPNLQHSGELHDTIVPQEGSAEDSTDDQKVLEDKEELNSKELKKLAHIGLQHSGELHDSLIPKEKETVKEGESMEAIKTPIQLQHSSELHDTVISKETENIHGESQEKVETSLGLQQEMVTVKEDKPMEAIKTPIQLQHSSELHDTVISTETENINGESQEKVETPLALQHSGKLHDAVISEDIITEDAKDKKIPNIEVSESPTTSPEKEASVAESTFASAAAAATKIQSLWRGFRVRKIGKAKVHELVDQHNVPESEISGNRPSLSDDDIMQAATKIQAGVRGYLTRKQQKNKISGTKENVSADEELHKALAQLDNAPIPSESPELARRKRETQMDISDNAVVKADNREENSTVTDKLSRSKSVRELGSGKLNVPAFSKSFSVTDSAISKTLDDDEERLRSLTEDTESLGEQTEDLGIGSEMSSTQQLDQGKITEEVLPDISQITENKKIVEEPAFVTDTLTPLHHSGELHDTVVHKDSKQIDDSSVIPQGGESMQEFPSKILPSDILKEQMTPKQLPELASTSDLQHSGELHDLLIPKETNITDQDPQKDNLSSPSLQHSGEIHDTVIMNKSDERDSIVDDSQLAEIESQVEQPHDSATTNENKQISEEELLSLIGLQYSRELRDIVIPKKKENESSGNDDGLAIPQLSTEQGDKSIVNESDIAEKDTVSPPYSLHHSSELHDTVISKKVEENKDVQADTSLITPNPEIPKESPETNEKNDSESLPLEHDSKLYEVVTTKENEENRDMEADAGLIATSPKLAVESADFSKIKDPETNAKDSSKSISLEHSSELHDAVIPKGSEKNKDIDADTGSITGSPQLAEKSPNTSKIKETETHAKYSSESLSLKHSSELHDAVIPKESEENKVIQADTGFLTVSPQLAVESPATLNENEENKEIEENVDLIAASPHLAEDTLKIKETETNPKDNLESISLEHSSELNDTAISKVSEQNKDIQVDSGLITPSPHLAEESAVTLKIKETEENTKDTPKSVSLEHSSELHDVITPKESEENKDIQADTGLVDVSPHLDEESPDTSKLKETETNGKGSSESTSLEHSSELHDAVIEKPGEENKDIQTEAPDLFTGSPEIAKESPDTSKMKAVTSNENEENKEIQQDVGLIPAKQHLAEKTKDISITEKTETNAKVTSESPSLELSSELHDAITPKGSEENKDIQADIGLLAASSEIAKESPDTSEMQAVTSNGNKENKEIQQDVGLIAANTHLAEQTPDISKIEKTETNAKDAFESTSLEHSSELHDAVTPKESEKNKNIETDTDLVADSPHLAEESPGTSKIKETETNVKDAPKSTSLEHSSELHDCVIPKESEKSKNIEADTDLIADSPHLAESPVTSKIKETETNAKDAPESTSLEHSSELHDAVIPKESEKSKNIETDTDLIAASPHLAEELPVTSKIKETETNAKYAPEATSLEHSSELHDAVTPKESEKDKNIDADTDLIDASPQLAEESPVTSKIKETETNAKDAPESTSFEHSSELHDAVTPKENEKDKNIEADTDLIAASPHLAEESLVSSKIMKTETNTKDTFESTSLEHSSELPDIVTPKESEKNTNIGVDTDLIAASPHLAEESPVTSKIKEIETNAKDVFESTSLEHSSELHDAVTPKESEKDKNIEADKDLIAASSNLAEESPVSSKIMETETNAKDAFESTSLEDSSELHDAVTPKENEKDKNIEVDTDLIAASPHFAEGSPVTLKIKETETNAKDAFESTSLEHSSELHDAVTPKESDKDKNIETDKDVIAASPHLAEELPVTSKIMETETKTNAKDSFQSSSFEHSSELHDPLPPKESEENKDRQADTGLIAASPQLAEELPNTSKIKETETNTKGNTESISLEHSSELHDTVISTASPKEETKKSTEDMLVSNTLKEKESLQGHISQLTTESQNILTISEETNSKPTTFQHSNKLRDTVVPNNIKQKKSLVISSPLLTEESKIEKSNGENNSAPVAVEHTSEMSNDLVPITVAEENSVRETQKLSMQSLPHEEESQNTVILNETEKDSKKDSCKDTATPNKIKGSENSDDQDSSTPVAVQNGSEMNKILAASTVDEQKTIKENQNLVAMSPQLADESHATSLVNEVEKVSEGGSPTPITLQHSSELHDPVISNETEEKGSLKMPRPALTEVKEIEKTVAVEHNSEADNTMIPDPIEKENVIQERERSLVPSPQSTEKSDDTATINENDQNREEDSSKSVVLQHSSDLHDTILTDGVKEEQIVSQDKSLITASPLLTENSNDSLAINKMAKTSEEDSSKSSVLQNSRELYDSAIPRLVEKEKNTQEDKSLIAASPQFSKETHGSLTANKTDKVEDNYESTTLQHSSELHDAVMPNDTISEDVPTIALQHSSEVGDDVVAQEAAVSTIASLQLAGEPHDVSKIEEIKQTDEEGKSTLSTSRHHSSELSDSKIPNEVKKAESGNMLETPQSNNEFGDASEVKAIKSDVKDDNHSEIDVVMADSTDENKYVKTAEATEEKHKQSPATTLRYDDVLSNGTEKYQTSEDLASAIPLPTEGMHDKFDKNSLDKKSINHKSLKSTDTEQDDALLKSTKHHEGAFQNDDDLAMTSPQLINQPLDIDTAKESGKADEMDQSSLTMLQHSSELHDTLMPIAIDKETLQDNTKLITEDPKTTDAGLTENVIDTSDKKDKSSQPRINELNNAALPNVSLEEPLASDKSVPTITPQLGENLQDSFEVKKSDLSPSSFSHSSELHDTVIPETVDNALQKRSDDLKVEESQTAKMHQKGDNRSVVPSPSADKADDLLVTKESDQNEEADLNKDVETSKTSEQQNNTLEDDVHLPASIDGDVLIDVDQQKQIDETPKQENPKIATLQHSSELHDVLIPKGIEDRNDLSQTHQNLQSHNLMSKDQDKENDVTSKENVEEKYEESHLSLLAADPHGDEHGGLITSKKEDPDVSTRKKIDESKQTSGDRKSASNDTTRESGNLESNVKQQDLEPKKESHVTAIIPTQAYSGKDDDSLSPKETEQEPTNSITAVPDLNEPTNLQHSGELHDLIFPPGDVCNKSNIDNNHVLGTTKLQSEKDGDGHKSHEHDNESGEAAPTSGLQHSGEFHDLLIPQADNSKQEEVRNSIVAVTSAEDTFENKIGVDDVTKPNGHLVTGSLNVGEQTGESSIKLQDEGSAVKDSEDGGQSADGSKTLAAQNQVQNVEVEKDDSNGNDIILNKPISSSVLDVPLECEAPASSTAAASGALSDDVQRDNYNLHHKTDEEAISQPMENLNSLSPIQDPHSRNTEHRKDALHNLDVDIQQPKQSSTELTTEELLSPHENIDSEEDQNKLDSERKKVKEILQNSANHPSTHSIDVNDVNNKYMENKNHNNEELHSKTEEFDKNLNKELEPLSKQGGHISSDFDMTALRAELTSVESQIENATNGSSTDNIEGKDTKLEEPVSSKTFNIAQLHSELENIVATQPDQDKHEITESDIIKNNVILENAPTPEKANREELNSITRVIDEQKDALSEISQAKARDNTLPNENSTAENKSKELETEVLSYGDTHSKNEDKHEEKAVDTNLTSDSSDVDSRTVADKATLPNIENDERNDISLESMKENTPDDDIPGHLKPLVNEELEEKELEKITAEVKDVLKDINDHRKISDPKGLNDDGKQVDDKITEDKQSSKITQDKQQSLSNTENNEKDSKNSTEDTSANEISEGVTKQEITELPLQNINKDDKESMEAVNSENIPNKTTSNGKKENILTSTKESPEEKIEENLIKDDNASNTFDMSKLRAELEQASNVLQSEANLKEDTAVEALRNQENQVQTIKETVNKLSIEDDKTESSKGVVDNDIPLKTSTDNDDSIIGKENLEKTLIPNSTNPPTFDISTLRTELEEIEKQIEANENETNTTDHKSGEIGTSAIFDFSKLRPELEKLETDENEDKGTISNDIDKLNKANENDLNEIQETANKLSQDKTKNSASEGSANVSESSNLSSPPHAVESKSEKASANESLAIDYESAPTRPATSDITPSISLNENIQIPSDNVYKHAQATDLEPHNSAEIITSGSFKGEGNDEKGDLGSATIKKQNVDVHINDKINEDNFKDSMLKSFSAAEFNLKDQLDNATKDKLKLEEEIERPVSISSTTSTDSVGTVIFNASSPREIDDDAESHFEMPQGNEPQKSKDNKSNLHLEEAKQSDGINIADDRHNHHEVVPDNNTVQSQAINELDADDVKQNNANSKDVKLINRSPVIPVEVTPGKVNAFDKGVDNNVTGRMSNLEEKVDSVDGSNASAVTASENNAISGKATVPQEATSTKDLDTNKANVSTINETTFIEGSNGYTEQKLDINKVNSIKIPQSNLQKEASNEDQDAAHTLKELVTPKKSEVKTIESTVIANVENEDNSNTKHMITNNLDVVQNIESNEKPEQKKIVQKSEEIYKESNNLQEVETHQDSQIKTNEDTIIAENTIQTRIKEPEISRSKLPHAETPPTNFTKRNDEDADVLANIEPTEKDKASKIQNSDEELIPQDMETNKNSEVKANERNIDNLLLLTKQDGLNSEIVGKYKEAKEPENTLSQLAPDETTPPDIKNKKFEVKESVPDHQETIKENNDLQEIAASNGSEANANEDNIITENDFQITDQNEIANKNELTEEPETAASKLALVGTSPAKLKNIDNNEAITSNLHGEQNIEPNEKDDVDKITKESNNLQESETNKRPGEANESNRTTDNVFQITKQDEMSAEIVSKNELQEEPKITSSKLPNVDTSFVNVTNINNKDVVIPNFDVAQNIEPSEMIEVKVESPEEIPKQTNDLQKIETKQSVEVKANEDDIPNADASQITKQNEMNVEPVSKKKLTEVAEIISPKLAHVQTSAPDIKNKDNKDIVISNLDAVEDIEANGKEIAPNAEETLKETMKLQEIKVNKSPETKADEDDSTATVPQITIHDEIRSEIVSKKELTEEPKITSSKLLHVEMSPVDVKNKDEDIVRPNLDADDEDIVRPNLDAAENIATSRKVDVNELAPNAEKTFKETNNLQELEVKKSSEVKANEGNIITETAAQITTQDEVNSESVSNNKPTGEPKIASSKTVLIETSPADIKNKDDKDIPTPNLDVAENTEGNKKVNMKEIASHPKETLKESNNLQEIEATRSPEVKPNEDNTTTATAPQITTLDEINVGIVNKHKPTEEPKITSSKLTHVETPPAGVKNKDISTPNLDVTENNEANKNVDAKEIASNPEKTLKEANNLQEIEPNKTSAVKENEDNLITANAPQITTQDEMKVESKNKLTVEPQITSSKLTLVEESPDLKNEDDKETVRPNFGTAQNTEQNKKTKIQEIALSPEESLKETNDLQEIEAKNSSELKANKDNIITANDSPIATQDGIHSESVNNNKLTEEPTSTSAKLTFAEASHVDLENKDDKDIITPNLDADEKVDIKEIVRNPEETVEGNYIEQEIKANKSLEVKANKDDIITANDSPIATQDEINTESVSNNKTIEDPKLTSAKLILVEASPTDLKNKNDEVTPALKVANEKIDIKEIAPNSKESLKETNNLQESKVSKSLEVEANEDNIITENDSPITKQYEMNSESVSKNELKEKPEITLSKLTLVTTSPTDVKNKGDKDNFTHNLDTAENIEANEKVDVKAISSNPEEATKSAEVKANEDNTTTESDFPITKQDEMYTKIVSKTKVKEEPEITSSKLALVETPPADVKNKDDQRIFSPNLDIAENIEPKEKVKPKEIAPNVEESLESNNLQEIEENKSSEVKANEEHTITENSSQINKHDKMNELEETPENISSKLAGIETSPADVKNYDKDMITPNSQFTEENKTNYGLVSKNEQEEEPRITSVKSVPVETSSPDVRNDNDNLEVAQKHEPHEAAGVKGTVVNTNEIINNDATFEIAKNNEQEKDIEKKGDKDAIITNLNVAEHIELNEKPEIKKVVQDPEKSNTLQVVETNKDINIKTNAESTIAENVPHFIIKEDVNTMVTGKDKQEETPKTTSSDLSLAETLCPDSRKENDKDIKDNIANNINKDVEPNEHKSIEKAEHIREIHLEIKNKPIDKSTDTKLQEKFLKSTQEAEPSEKHKTILEAAAIEEVGSKEKNHEMGKTTKEQVTGINDEDLPMEEQHLVQDKKSDQNRLDNSVTLLQEQGAHLNQHGAATKIQSGYRGYRVRRSLTMPLLETSSSKISNDSDEVDEHIKNTLLRHVEYDNNKTIQEAEVPSKIDLSPDVSTKYLNTDKNLASADLDNHKETLITPGDPKQSKDIRSTSPPTALMNFEDEDGSYDPFKHASAPPLSLLEHEDEFDLHNQSMVASHPLEETDQTDELLTPSDSKEKQRTAVDKIMDVASAPTHLLTSKSILDNKLSPAAERNNASPSEKEKIGEVHVSSVEQPEGVSPRFHNDKDRPVTQALEIVLDQQLALAAPSAVKKEESVESEGPEYIYIPLKDPNVSSPSKSLSEGLQHSGEYHDSVVVPLLTNAPPKDTNVDATSSAEPKEQKIDDEHAISSDSIIEEDEDSSKYDLVDNHKSPRTQIENEGAVTKALGAVLDQQLAITTPKAKPKEEESSEEPKYIYIPLKDPNQESSFEEKDLAETKNEEAVSEQDGDKPVLGLVRHYETVPQKETKIEVHNKDSAFNNVEKQQNKLLLTKTIDVTPNTSSSEEAQPDTESEIVSPMQQIQTKTDGNHDGFPISVNSSVVNEDESHPSLTQSDTTPETSSYEEAQPLTESKPEVLTTSGQFGQASGATALVLSSNLADAASSPVVITHQSSATRSGSADIRPTIPPGTPTFGLQVRFSPSPTQNVEEISASVSPIGERREGPHSTQEDRSVQSDSPPLLIQTTQISDVLPVAVQLNQPPAGAAVLTSPTRSDAGASVTAHAPSGGASTKDGAPGGGAHFQLSMETADRTEAPTNGENMEELAATKIQASFRGYQVRKQLKCKNGGVESLRRSLRRKSSGKLRGSDKASQKVPKNTDLEEKSATKIQAGIRGFLVRRRQKKAKGNSSPESS